MIKWLKRKYYLRKYKKWHDRNFQHYLDNPDDLKALIIKLKWMDYKEGKEDFKWFTDWSEGWLKQEGYW